MAQTLEGHISISKAPFLTILASLKSPLSPLFNDTKIVKNGALDLEIGSFTICNMSQTIL